jgi:predicted ABC-type ATPase
MFDYRKGGVLESLPIYWGNCEWVRDPSGLILPLMGILPDNPKWIDYDRESKRSVSRDLLENEHPDRPFRTVLHKQILRSIMISASPVPVGVEPHCVLTHGGIASGKTAAIELFLESQPEFATSVLHLDFDRIKRELPEFVFMKAKGTITAASFVQSESAKISGTALKQAIKLKTNLIYEGSLVDIGTMEERIEDMHRSGYLVSVVATHVPESKGHERATLRFKEGGRYVPPENIVHTFRRCPLTLVELKSLVDYVLLVDNSFDNLPARQILEIEKGTVRIIDTGLYRDYLNLVGTEADLTK